MASFPMTQKKAELTVPPGRMTTSGAIAGQRNRGRQRRRTKSAFADETAP